MKTFRLITISMVFAAIFAVSAFAQVGAGKIGVINTFEFDTEQGKPGTGITKYVTAQNRLDTEFKTDTAAIKTMVDRINALKKEIDTLQKAGDKVPVANITAKAEDHDKLVRELKFKQEDAKARYESRRQIIMGPVLQDIGKAMQEFATKNGYAIILDAAKLDQAGLILAFDRKYDVTDEFVKFYNSRPPGTASN